MPTSDAWGKDAVRDSLLRHARRYGAPTLVVDIGPGDGTYSRLLRQPLAEIAKGAGHTPPRWVGVEAWGPYVSTYGLAGPGGPYDTVVVADATVVDWETVIDGDETAWVIAGDVFEHMEPGGGEAVLMRLSAQDSVRLIAAAAPVCHSPQGAVGGNPFEEHRRQFTPESFREMLAYGTLATPVTLCGDVVGYGVVAFGDRFYFEEVSGAEG